LNNSYKLLNILFSNMLTEKELEFLKRILDFASRVKFYEFQFLNSRLVPAVPKIQHFFHSILIILHALHSLALFLTLPISYKSKNFTFIIVHAISLLGSFGGGVSKLVLYLSTIEYVTLMEGILTFNHTTGKININ